MTTENATQTGAFESGSSARSNALAEIAKQVHEQNAEDFSAFNEESGEVLKKAPEQEAEATVETTVDDADAETTQTTQTTQDDGLETLLIDGKETRVKREQVLDAGKRTLQKEAAADRRLEEAAETLRRAKAYEQGIMQRQPSSDAGSQQQVSTDPANGNGDTRQHQATPDARTLVREELWIHDANKAATRFKEEFKDLVDDPYAARLVAQLEDERLQKAAAEGAPLGDPWDAYKKHGEQIRSWMGKAKPKEPVVVSADKTERKRDTVTVTGSTTSRPAPTQAKPPTNSELIERERERRKQGRSIQPSR